jgi:hypothetical protein
MTLRRQPFVHVPMHFGPETFLAVVGSPTCAECAVAPDDAPLCETDLGRWFDATFGAAPDGAMVLLCGCTSAP